MQKKSDTPFYRRIIADAWRIAWQHKHLWVFGFFATVVGFGGVTEVAVNASKDLYAFYPSAASGLTPESGFPGYSTIRAIISLSSFPAVSLMFFVAIMALFIAVFAWMTYTSIGALVHAAKKISKGGEPTFGDGVKLGAEHFWKVLAVNVITQLFVFCGYLLTATTLAVMMRDGTASSGLFYIGTFIVFTVLAIAASIAAVYATCSTVLHDDGIEMSLMEGWRLLMEHWLVSLEMTVALFVASLVIGMAAVLLALIASVPLIFIMVVLAVLRIPEGTVAILLLGSAMMLAMIVCVGSFITVFQTSAWTLLWGEIADRKPLAAKLHRLARKVHPWLV